MRIAVIGTDPPGRTFSDPDGTPLGNVHVGIQVGTEPEHLVRGDVYDARWEIDIRILVDGDRAIDFRGPAVHGKRGERFIYLTWGNVDDARAFRMFRRAKLMLNGVDPDLIRDASEHGSLTARVRLSDDRGAPRCARVDPPAISWTLD